VSKIKLTEIAARINAHLKRFERDPTINAPSKVYHTKPYYCARSWQAGTRVCVQYVSFQYTSKLKRDNALAYLAWLDAGGIGTHWQAEREGSKPKGEDARSAAECEAREPGDAEAARAQTIPDDDSERGLR
jgi:hypothetical protein